VAFHVEISSGLNHARAFNLGAEHLREAVLEPWVARRTVELGEQEWDPREHTLRILEGPQLDTPDLAFGQGWSNAERSAKDVTERELAQTQPTGLPDAFVVETDLPEATVAAMLSGQQAAPVAFADITEALDRRDPEVAAVIVVKRTAKG
jgi:hypothetical protein